MQKTYKANITYNPYPADPTQIHWCSLCFYGRIKDDEDVCINKKLFDLLWNGPDRVNPFGGCDKFVNRYSKEAKVLQKSDFVEKLIEATGIRQH